MSPVFAQEEEQEIQIEIEIEIEAGGGVEAGIASSDGGISKAEWFHCTRIHTILDGRLGLPDNKAMKLLTSTSAPLQP